MLIQTLSSALTETYLVLNGDCYQEFMRWTAVLKVGSMTSHLGVAHKKL